MKEYIVTLNNISDKTTFCNEMTASSGSGSIPSRACTCSLMRPSSRNSHFTLTDEEAAELKNDSRVLDCAEPVSHTAELWDASQTGDWDKTPDGAADKNWGIKRCIDGQATASWGSDGTSQQTGSYNTTSSGKHVDVIIVDRHLNFDHPEFKENPDGTGNSRAVQFNWFSYSSALGHSTNANYSYAGGTSSHGTHVAGIAAGNTQGWARDANIYNMAFSNDAEGGNGVTNWTNILFEYVRHFHNNKAINPATGRRNPTICNNSWSSVWSNDVTPLGNVSAVKYRTVNTSMTGMTDAQKKTTLEARRVPVPVAGEIGVFGIRSTALEADIVDCINDGVIMIGSAGNSYFPLDISTGADWGNSIVIGGAGVECCQGGSPGSAPNVISVGAIAATVSETKTNFSCFEERVDVYAPGRNIMSSVRNNSSGYGNQQPDPRDSNFYNASASGTSMSGPQVAGLLACAAEQFPNMRPADALQYLKEGAKAQIASTGEDPPTQSPYTSFGDGNNRYVSYVYKRPQSGTAFPHDNHGNRVPTSNGVKYPRVNSVVTKPS